MLEFSRLQNPIKHLANSKQVADKVAINGTDGIPHVPIEQNLATVEYNDDRRQFLRVRFQGVSWRAKYPCMTGDRHPYNQPGTPVKVLYRQGNTLIVEAIAQL